MYMSVMKSNIERIDRYTMPSFLAINAYKQEVEKPKKSNEGNIVYTEDALEFPEYMGTRINIVVGG